MIIRFIYLFLILTPCFVYSQIDDLLKQKGCAFSSSNKHQEALAIYNQLVFKNPSNYESYFLRSYCRFNLGKYNEAISDCNKSYSLLLDDKAQISKIEGAEAFINTKYNILWLKGLSYYELKKWDSVVSIFNAYLLMYFENYEGYRYRAYAYYSLDKYDESIKDFNRNLLDPKNTPEHVIWANSMLAYCYLEKDDTLTAKMYINKAKSIDSTNYYYNRVNGDFYYDLKKYSKALKFYNLNCAFDTANCNTFRIAYCHYKLGEVNTALKEFKILSNDPEDKSISLNMIAWIFFEQKKYAKALPIASEAIKVDITNSDALDTRACIYYKLGKYQDAIKDFDKGLKLDSAITNSYYFRGLTFIKLGNIKNACKDFSNVILDKNYITMEGEVDAQKLINQYCPK
jgi:tetratricopeptide (TPR) repeat protein